MALDERYLIAAPLNQYFVDKVTGLPLAGGKVYFYRDTSRTTPKTVYQLTGTPPNYSYVALPNPMTLSSVGTFVNNTNEQVAVYFYPFTGANNTVDLYYIVCEDADGNLQWTREGWPNITEGNNPANFPFSTVNQISNPQFTRMFFQAGESVTLTVSSATDEVFPIAPNWDFVISGTGAVVVEQVAISGNENIETSPPYVLDVNISSGITDCKLRQKFNVNSGLWASTVDRSIFLSGKVLIKNQESATKGIEVFYNESTGGTPVSIISSTFDDSGYQLISGVTTSALPASTNTDSGTTGYVEIYAELPSDTHLRIGSFQIVPSLSLATANEISFDESSANRAQALMGDYYIPRLEAKRIPSLLVGWDFPLNPAQWGSAGTVTTSAAYIWDQTIAVSSVANISYAKNGSTGSIDFANTADGNSLAIIQYLDGSQAHEILGTSLSSNINAWRTTAGNDVTVRVYLYRGSTAAVFPTLPSIIGSLSADGEFTLTTANWTEIPRSNLPTAKATLSIATQNSDLNNSDMDYKFNGWEITDNAQIADTEKFAIVVTFAFPSAANVIGVTSVSLNHGDIPTRPAPETKKAVLEKCKYYWEQSYPQGTPPLTHTNENQYVLNEPFVRVPYPGAGEITVVCNVSLTIEYAHKRTNGPNVVCYSSELAAYGDTVDGWISTLEQQYFGPHIMNFGDLFLLRSIGSDRVVYLPLNDTQPFNTFWMYTGSGFTGAFDQYNSSGWLQFQYTVDARIGMVA